MTHDRGRDRGPNRDVEQGAGAGAGPGKSTLVEQLQRKAAPTGGAGAGKATPVDGVHETAQTGLSGSSQRLPHLDAIQRSFGRHEVGGVRAFVGGPAADASRALGAEAYATGDAVAFARSPDLHTAAHEAAHVVQQRAGVQLLGGVGREGDAYEQHADAVADLVVQGKSAEATLDQMAPAGGGAGGRAVQRAPAKTHYGEFKDQYFSEIKKDGTVVGVDMYLTFTPNAEVDATKIAISQSVMSYVEGNAISIDATKDNQQVKSGAGKGYYIDQLSQHRNPLYATGAEPASKKDELGSYATPAPVAELSKAEKDANTAAKITGPKYGGWGEHGHRKKEGAAWKTKDAELHDGPTMPSNKANSGTVFETTALAIDGNQKGTYYGSVSWGMKTDATGKLAKVEMAKVSEAVPGQNFMASAKLWNSTTARGTLVTAAADTKVFDDTLTEKFKLPKDVKVELVRQAIANDVIYLFVKVDAGAAAHAGKTGYIKGTDAKDKGDGAANVKLPYVDVKLTTAAVKLFKAKDKKDQMLELPKDTRLRVLADGDVQQVEVVDGTHTAKTGWIDKGQIKNEA